MKLLKIVAVILVLTSAASAKAGLIHDFTIKSDDGVTVDLAGTLVLTKELPAMFDFPISGNTFIASLDLTEGVAFGLAYDEYVESSAIGWGGIFVGTYEQLSMQIVLSAPTRAAFGPQGILYSLGWTTNLTFAKLDNGIFVTQTNIEFTNRTDAPVPVPASPALLGLGLAVLGLNRRKHLTRP